MNLKTVMKWLAVGLVLAVGVFAMEYFEIRDFLRLWFENDLEPWLADNPVLAPFVFMGVYILSVVAMAPASILTLIGGAVFGPVLGTLYVIFAATIGAGLAFLVSRYMAADWVEKNVDGKIEKIKKGIEDDGWKFVAFTRLVPLFPFNMLNYMFGLTKINFWVYFFVSLVTMIPGTFAYVYTGYAAKVAAAGEEGIGQTLIYIGIAVGLLILISMLPGWIKRLRGNEFGK